MKVASNIFGFVTLALSALTVPTHGLGYGSEQSGLNGLACWQFDALTPSTTLTDGERVEDHCNDHDARVIGQLDVTEGWIPGSSALSFSSGSSAALAFEPGFDFGDGGPVAGSEFDFAGDDSFTLEAVVRIPSDFTGVGSLVAKDVGPGQASWWFRVNNGRLQALISDGDSQSVMGSRSVNDDAWHHVALVRDADADTMSLYVDFELDATIDTQPMGDIATPPGTPVMIGAFNSGSRQLEGDMQAARITQQSLQPEAFLLHDEVVSVNVSMDHDGQALVPGGTTEYLVTVRHVGGVPAVGLSVEAPMPSWFDAASWSCVAIGGASCAASGNGDLIDSVDLPVDGEVVYTVNVDLAAELPELMFYTVTVEPDGQILLGNSTASALATPEGMNWRLHVSPSAAPGGDGWSWDTAFDNLQDALTRARELTELSEVTIWVAGGVYYPDEGAGQSSNSRLEAFELADDIEIYGGFDGTETELEQRDWLANPTVLSGDVDQNDTTNSDGVTEHWDDIYANNSYHVVRGNQLTNAVLDGFIVTGGLARPAGGGDIGGIYERTNGAAIYLRRSSVSLRNLRVQGNFSYEFSGRGVLFMDASGHTLHLSDSTFINNHAYYGGAAAILRGNLVGDGLEFHGNQAEYGGGALYQYLGSYVLNNSVFTGNTAPTGGAIFSYNIHAALVNCLVSGNYASERGGGIYFWDQSGPISGALVLTNCTFTGNRAGTIGGAINRGRTQTEGQHTEATNTIIWNNQDSTGVGTASASHGGSSAEKLTARHSLLQGFDLEGDGNFDGTDPANAPAFLAAIAPQDAPTTAGDFRLESGTPLMDAGDNQARINPNPGFDPPIPPIPIEGNILFDLDGSDRFMDGDGDGITQVDLGPYEALGVQGRSIGGIVTDLDGSGLVLQNNGGDDLPIISNGGFAFATELGDGHDYNVTVHTQPTDPSQICIVNNGTGTLDGEDVDDIEVVCTTNSFGVGGTVTGLNGSGLVLRNNGGDDLPITASGGFAFATALDDGSDYNVTVHAQPTDLSQTCIVNNGTGTLDGEDVDDIEVVCTTNSFSIGGTVTGLNGSGLVLRNNGGDDLPITASGGFTFATALDDGSDYNVTIHTQPTDLSQTCIVNNGSGALGGEDVDDIEVVCTTNSFSIGGTVTGLNGSGLVLRNNGGDDLPVSASGEFTFATALGDGSDYDVTVAAAPNDPPQYCTVAAGEGVVDGGDVTDILVSCTDRPDGLFSDRFQE